jgi:ubiquinone/menaquinone biosynthesis C-methylase UbiE
MPRTSRHYVVGVAGLGIFRTWLAADPERLGAATAHLVRLATGDQPELAIPLDAPEHGVRDGYARWADTYDTMPNALIGLEEPAVHALVDAWPTGVALDAACGTGRHARHLAARGHRVIGVDVTPEMLAHARRALPDADLRIGDLGALPVETASVDGAVCALALEHCERLGPPIAELARVLRPGGRLVISDFHPMQVELGGAAFFVAADGTAGRVRSYAHLHGEYLDAFAAAGLGVVRCVEPLLRADDVAVMSGGLMGVAPDAFRDALVGLPAALVWELVRDPA